MSPEQFEIFPAIDLRAGRVVRLAQGDPARQTVYGADARAAAERWRAEGARWVHVVNLDGAFGGDTHANQQALAAILQTGLCVQFGGGLRDEASVRRAMEAGAARVVLGTAAIENPALVEWALRDYGPERVAVGIDAREGRVRIQGWRTDTIVTALELAQGWRARGLEWCVFTDVARDGVGAGLNVAAAAQLARDTGLRVIASGGAAALADVQAAREAGLAGVVLGRALYQGALRFAEALGNAHISPEGGLAGDGLLLRPPRLAEMDFIRQLWGDEATMRPVGGPVLLDDEQARRWHALMVNPGRPTDCFCLIFAGDEPVGEVSFHRLERATMTADFNIKMLAARRGCGLGRAAMRLLLDYFFNTLGGQVMLDDLALDNPVGQRALLRFGFERDVSVTDVFRLRLTRERFNALHRAA
jgi:phosphoribosylformimino-5-aminoimidazole carboxamide ribotide isomerase